MEECTGAIEQGPTTDGLFLEDVSNDTRLALWVAAAMHDFGMFQPTQRGLDVENAIPLCGPILDALCPPSLRPLVEFAIRNHDFIPPRSA